MHKLSEILLFLLVADRPQGELYFPCLMKVLAFRPGFIANAKVVDGSEVNLMQVLCRGL